jgi:hypothetical protein
MIMGYQGWFSCPGDAAGRGWVHWKAAQKDVTVEMLPDVSELAPSERCDSGLVARNGKPVEFFSDMNPQTVDRQFGWMQTYGIDGVALQRFASVLLHPEIEKASDAVLGNVRESAEKHGRVFFLMYDLSSMPAAKLDLIVEDWRKWVAQGLTKSSAYLHHKGRPVLGIWGVGLKGHDLTPEQFEALMTQLRAVDGAAGVTVLGGVPVWWREGGGGVSPDPGWRRVWPKLDVISPWTVGFYKDDAGADNYRRRFLEPDLAAAKKMGVDYMPVVFPGFSWSNLMRVRNNLEKAIPNQIPRRCGALYWRQVVNAIDAGATMLYTAMFDEVDEGTAMFKLDVSASNSPEKPSFLTLDADGCPVSSDWYLRLGGAAQAAFAKRPGWSAFPLKTPDSH